MNKPVPKIISFLFVLRWPLVFRCVRWFIKKLIPNLKNSRFSSWFECQYGNVICEENTLLVDTKFLDYWNIYIWEWTSFTRGNICITWDHPMEYRDGKYCRGTTSKDIHIWKNCWITTNCIILSGVRIGDNVTIWAWSVVTKDIPPNCIAAWVPCKVIRFIE